MYSPCRKTQITFMPESSMWEWATPDVYLSRSISYGFLSLCRGVIGCRPGKLCHYLFAGSESTWTLQQNLSIFRMWHDWRDCWCNEVKSPFWKGFVTGLGVRCMSRAPAEGLRTDPFGCAAHPDKTSNTAMGQLKHPWRRSITGHPQNRYQSWHDVHPQKDLSAFFRPFGPSLDQVSFLLDILSICFQFYVAIWCFMKLYIYQLLCS